MSLKQAYDLYKKVIKFQDGIDKISKGNLTDEDSIKIIITSLSFIFNMGKNKKQYEKSTFKAMQYAFWQTVIETGGMYAEFPISANFLQHSLEENPDDIVITEGKVIQEIYSQPKLPSQYYNDTSSVAKSLLSSTLYNLASFSVRSEVMKEYYIDIKIHIDEFEVV